MAVTESNLPVFYKYRRYRDLCTYTGETTYKIRLFGKYLIAQQSAQHILICDGEEVRLDTKLTEKLPEPGNFVVVYGHLKFSDDGQVLEKLTVHFFEDLGLDENVYLEYKELMQELAEKFD